MATNYKSIKATGENAIEPDTEAWNIADGFTKIKILRLLIQLDIDEEISKFGYRDEEIIEESYIEERRVLYFNKFVFHLGQLIGNAIFTIREKKDKEMIEIFKYRLRNVEDKLPEISTTQMDYIRGERKVVIQNIMFDKCYYIARDIKDELNIYLNKAGLIFRQGDELDLDKIMNNIIEMG